MKPPTLDEIISYLKEHIDGRSAAVLSVNEMQTLMAALAAPVPAREWIPVGERLPETGEWCDVLVDRNEGDYFARKDKPRYSVTPATLVAVDSEGNGTWHRGTFASGAPLDVVNYVTHWMPLPPPPAADK